MQMLSIDAIKLDQRCQPRATMDPELIQDYAAAMTEGAEFPPLTVYRDGSTYWLADGFHRIAAAQEAGQAHVVCNVERGTIRDAILHAVGANSTHGKRRTNLDKRRAVETLLTDAEWEKWNDSQIARQCAVSSNFVGVMRRSLSSDESEIPTERTYTDRYGNVRTMNTANIGKKAPPSDPGPDVDVEADDIEDDEDEKSGFVCDECGEIFSVDVWHCPQCDHHWSEGDDTCKNCYRPREGFIEDEEDDEDDPTPVAGWSVVGMNTLRYERLPEPHQRARAMVREIIAHEGESFLPHLIAEAEKHIG